MRAVEGLYRDAEGNLPDEDGSATEEELVELLEAAARQGTVTAIKLLMEYRAGTWPKGREGPPKPQSVADGLVADRDEKP